MKFTNSGLDGVLIVQQEAFPDSRGHFMETCRASDFPVTFVQDNMSVSKAGVIRGLHYQLVQPQAKLVTVMRGSILDVAVDIRKGSPTFGKFYLILLDSGHSRQLFIPTGFAHGFQALVDNTVVHYKCSDYYHGPSSRTIRFDDPAIGIPWKLLPVIISDKDKDSPLLKDAEVPEYNK
jgi:dTDP-4-dehydrorhamnose 3,5-epimerase